MVPTPTHESNCGIVVSEFLGEKENTTSKGENDGRPKTPRICFSDPCHHAWLFDTVADAGARQLSAVHHGLNRYLFDGPRCGDCDGPQRGPGLHFKRGQGAGSWTAWL